MPLGYFNMANWKKTVLVLLVLIAVAPFVRLHLFVLCARFFESKLQGATIAAGNGVAPGQVGVKPVSVLGRFVRSVLRN